MERGMGRDGYVQTVPIRPMPNARTCIGTVRGAFSLSEKELIMLAFFLCKMVMVFVRYDVWTRVQV